MRFLEQFEITDLFVYSNWLYISFNKIFTQDDYFQLGDAYEHPDGFLNYDSIAKDIVANQKIDPFTGCRLYFEAAIVMSDNLITHSRRIYGLLDVLGDFGGLNEVVMSILALLLSPWVEFQFNLKALQKLYLVKTRRTDQFRQSGNDKYRKKREKSLNYLQTEEDKQ